MPVKSVMPSNHLILCHPLLLLPSIIPSIRVFSDESVLRIKWPKYWSFSFSIHPSNEHPGLISLRMDWLHLLAVRGTLKSLLQHHSSKASIFRHSAFFIVQLSHPYMTIGKTVAWWMCLMPLNCTLEMATVVRFELYVFYLYWKWGSECLADGLGDGWCRRKSPLSRLRLLR